MSVKTSITLYIPGKEPKTYDLDSFEKDVIKLGRGSFHGNESDGKNDICIDTDVSIISRAHCTFRKADGVWSIEDDKSVNGLIFNGKKIPSKQLHDGDKLHIGTDLSERCIIAFSSQSSAADSEKYSLKGKNSFVIGRDGSCDIVINHPSVSRRHCIISSENGNYFITDNNSMNGVILNGSTLKGRQQLQQMDKITIADTSFVFCDEMLYSRKNMGGVSVAVHNLFKKVKAGSGEKYITNDVNLSIEPGEFVAIVGGSGAGKTTLLNCLSGMTDFTSGDVLVNGESITAGNRSVRSIIGYVPQNDIVYDSLTLERMLHYSARLRMPKDTTKEEIRQKIDETLEMVELTAHRKTLISKLSGGQKKRASIAVELLASPKLFFLDEPSSGLDPGTEKNLMAMLKRLAETGKTVIMVTHTVQNINMCDRLICMGNGGLLCYSGQPARAPEFFGKENMTDIYDDLNDNSKSVSERFAAQNNPVRNFIPLASLGAEKKKFGFLEGLRQFTVLTGRYTEITINSRLRLILLVAMPVVLSLLVCLAFQADGNLYNTLGIVIDRDSLPFMVADDTLKLMFAFACAAFWVGIFNSVQEISKERIIYERERFTGVKPVPYVMSKFTVIGILCFVQSVIMVGMLLFFTTTTATVDGNVDSITAISLSITENGVVLGDGLAWLELFMTTFLAIMSAMCLGLAISSAVSNEMALVVCPVCLLPQILFSGVACTLSGITETISKIVTCRWACIAYLTTSGINDMYYSCYYDTGTWVKTEFENGFGVDEAYSATTSYIFGLDPVSSSWVVLGIMSLVCVIAAVLFLYIKGIRIRPAIKKSK